MHTTGGLTSHGACVEKLIKLTYTALTCILSLRAIDFKSLHNVYYPLKIKRFRSTKLEGWVFFEKIEFEPL
jgi:hypothetical protein